MEKLTYDWNWLALASISCGGVDHCGDVPCGGVTCGDVPCGDVPCGYSKEKVKQDYMQPALFLISYQQLADEKSSYLVHSEIGSCCLLCIALLHGNTPGKFVRLPCAIQIEQLSYHLFVE
nr:hypothetical protein Iba_chr08eCG0380 [Ipomoea batatas]